jgi:hypothetical protein
MVSVSGATPFAGALRLLEGSSSRRDSALAAMASNCGLRSQSGHEHSNTGER